MGHSASKYDDIVNRLKTLCDRPFVDAVEDHYACYWDELGLSVKVRDDTPDSNVIALRNSLLNLLSDVLPKGNPDFTWLIGFRRRNKTIEVLSPDDEARDLTDVLRPI
jgi:hypothetical protein